MHHANRHIALLLMFVALFGAPPAMGQSQNANAGRLNAYSCEQMPAPARIDVQMLDDAPRYLRLRDRLIKQMKADGTKVMAGAPLVLTIDVKTVREFQQPDRGRMGKLRVGKGGVSLQGNIWSNTDNSVLGGPKKSANRLAVDQLQLTANLNWRDNGRCVWQGEILHELRGGDPDRTAYRFMPVLADAIGRAIQNQPVMMSE